MLDFFLFLLLFLGIPFLLLYVFVFPIIRNFKLKMLYHPTALALVIANSYTLFGLFFLDWSLFNVICLFWLENIAVGFFNVLRMRKAQGPLKGTELYGKPYTRKERSSLIYFFLMHFGGFTLVHGIFVFTLFNTNGMSLVEVIGIAFGLVFLFASHGFSYRKNYLGNKEYNNVSEETLFTEPYKRMLLLHTSIVVGGIFAGSASSTVFVVTLLIILKTVLDAVSHVQEHKKFSHVV